MPPLAALSPLNTPQIGEVGSDQRATPDSAGGESFEATLSLALQSTEAGGPSRPDGSSSIIGSQPPSQQGADTDSETLADLADPSLIGSMWVALAPMAVPTVVQPAQIAEAASIASASGDGTTIAPAVALALPPDGRAAASADQRMIAPPPSAGSSAPTADTPSPLTPTGVSAEPAAASTPLVDAVLEAFVEPTTGESRPVARLATTPIPGATVPQQHQPASAENAATPSTQGMARVPLPGVDRTAVATAQDAETPLLGPTRQPLSTQIPASTYTASTQTGAIPSVSPATIAETAPAGQASPLSGTPLIAGALTTGTSATTAGGQPSGAPTLSIAALQPEATAAGATSAPSEPVAAPPSFRVQVASVAGQQGWAADAQAGQGSANTGEGRQQPTIQALRTNGPVLATDGKGAVPAVPAVERRRIDTGEVASTEPVDADPAIMIVPMPGAAPATGTVEPSTSEAPAAVALADQLAGGVQFASQRPGRTVRVVLQPEGLGTVALRVDMGASRLGIHINVDSVAVRELIEASRGQLQQSLDRLGISAQAIQINVSGGNAGNQTFFRQPGSQGRSRSSTASSVQRIDEESIPSIRTAPDPRAGRVDYRV